MQTINLGENLNEKSHIVVSKKQKLFYAKTLKKKRKPLNINIKTNKK